jgi:hypothetical protein
MDAISNLSVRVTLALIFGGFFVHTARIGPGEHHISYETD